MITLERVTKYYPTPHGRHCVLSDVSVEIPAGTKIAVLGLNGAGKSTLMRLLSGVDVPNSGKIVRKGNISWPMGLASCMQKSMTGAENARFACRIQGASSADVDQKLTAIKEFAEIGDYFDMPVRSYSSGMRARLQFAIAMAFDFDCYLIDELTSVGDQSFKSKSERVFREKRQDASFIKASHNLGELMRDCEAGLVLHAGELTYHASMAEAARAYQVIVGKQERRQIKKQRRSLMRQGVDLEMVDSLAPLPERLTPQQRQAQRLARKQEKLRRRSRKEARSRLPTGSSLTRDEKKARRQTLRKRQRALRGTGAAGGHFVSQLPKGSRIRISSTTTHRPAPMAPRARRDRG